MGKIQNLKCYTGGRYGYNWALNSYATVSI